jgi:hypothetical protein
MMRKLYQGQNQWQAQWSSLLSSTRKLVGQPVKKSMKAANFQGVCYVT